MAGTHSLPIQLFILTYKIIHSSPIQLLILYLFNYSFFTYSIIHSSSIQLFILHLFNYLFFTYSPIHSQHWPSGRTARPKNRPTCFPDASQKTDPKPSFFESRVFSSKKYLMIVQVFFFWDVKKYFFLLRPFWRTVFENTQGCNRTILRQ